MNDHVHWLLIGSFDAYPGNFEREVTWWVFGEGDDYVDRSVERPHSEEMEWAGGGYMEGKLQFFPHDEYGSVCSETLNHTDLKWEFMEGIEDDEWAAMLRAFDTFPEGNKLTDLKLYRVETKHNIEKEL